MAEFKLTFLGTGTSVGIPAIGCDCSVCHSNDPKDKRFRSSIWVRGPGASWLVDSGPDLRQQCLRAGIKSIDAVLYTHPHTDHIMGFDDLRRFSWQRGGNLPIYARKETIEALSSAFFFAFDDAKRMPGYIHPQPHLIDGPFALGRTRISPIPVVHGMVDTIGYLMHPEGGPRIAYISDMKEITAEGRTLLEGVDVLITDGLRHRPHPTHQTISEAIALSEQLGSPETWLTHMSCEVSHEKDSDNLPSHVRLAYDTLTLSYPCTPSTPD